MIKSESQLIKLKKVASILNILVEHYDKYEDLAAKAEIDFIMSGLMDAKLCKGDTHEMNRIS